MTPFDSKASIVAAYQGNSMELPFRQRNTAVHQSFDAVMGP